MKFTLNKLAAILAFIIGGMAIFAGGKVVILHIPVDYYVIDWLPVYNFTMGLITFFVTAVLLWKDADIAPKLTVATLGVHSLVMLILQTAYKNVVAPDSIRAMTFRIVTWVIITAIVIVHERKKKASTAS